MMKTEAEVKGDGFYCPPAEIHLVFFTVVPYLFFLKWCNSGIHN